MQIRDQNDQNFYVNGMGMISADPTIDQTPLVCSATLQPSAQPLETLNKSSRILALPSN
jgi:hypothetical protein